MSESNEIERLIKENTAFKERISHLESQIQQKLVLGFEEASEDMQHFAYVATHDLKAPLNNMLGYISLLKMDLEDAPGEISDYLKWLEYSVDEARKTIEELTAVLRLKNKEKKTPELINLDSLTEGILAGLRATILKEKVFFICDFSAVLEVNYFPIALRSILQNLIVNACNYMDPNKGLSEVWITSKRIEKEVIIQIKDNGVGMDMEGKGKVLFDAFARMSEKPGGTGIGMYIVKKFLKSYGGRIEVESVLGEGTSFSIYLPDN